MTSFISRSFAYAPASSETYEFAYENAAESIQGLRADLPRNEHQQALEAVEHRQGALRVVVVTPCLARGGAEQWLVYLARFLDPDRARIVRTIVTNPKFVDPEFADDLHMPVEIGTPETLKRAAEECDILLCWGVKLDDTLVPARDKPCVYVAHGEGDWTKRLVQESAEYIDHLVAVSQRVQQRVGNGYPSTVIHNGVDTARLGQTQPTESVRRSLSIDRKDFVLGYVGRFSGEKRVEAIIDAVAELPVNFKAMFVGWGPGRQALMDRANARIPGRFVFLKASEYLGDFYRAMDAVCLVSSEEGFSMVMLEAMMCERPVIATPVGAAPEVVKDRVNGVLVEGSPSSIGEAAQLLNDHPGWASGVAREGRRYAEYNGHALRMARDYQQLFESLCSSR